jgi:hypothetical protein
VICKAGTVPRARRFQRGAPPIMPTSARKNRRTVGDWSEVNLVMLFADSCSRMIFIWHGRGRACPARAGRSKRRPYVRYCAAWRSVHMPSSDTVFMKRGT